MLNEEKDTFLMDLFAWKENEDGTERKRRKRRKEETRNHTLPDLTEEEVFSLEAEISCLAS